MMTVLSLLPVYIKLAPNRLQQKIQTKMQQQTIHKINLISITCAILSFMLILLYWEEFSIFKKLLLILLMSLFIIILVRNLFFKSQASQRKYLKIDSPLNQYTGPNANTISRISNFFTHFSQNQEKDFNQNKKSLWNRGFMYSSERITRTQSAPSNYSSYFNKFQAQKGEDRGSKSQIRLFIPQNLNLIFEEIKQKVDPRKYLNKFRNFVENLKQGQGNARGYKLQTYCSQSQSLIFNENKKLLLERQHDVIISEEIDCAEIVCQYLQGRLQEILNATKYNFKTVSELVMKLFGMKVNFYINQQQNNDFDMQQVTITELRDFLFRVRKDSFIPQKFKPSVPIKQFMHNYLDRLLISTEAVVKFLEFNQKDEEMAFRLYIEILNQQFNDDKIVITKNLSGLSQEMKKIKHTFFVHKLGSQISFTYNRIRRFVTTNPLVVVLAYFAEDYKIGKHKNYNISRDLNKFFKEKSHIPSNSVK